MRCTSAAIMKRGRKKGYNPRPAPREGSELRVVYDTLQASRGIPIEFAPSRALLMRFRDLTDFYGLDIRGTDRGDRRTNRPSKFVLAGEWFGRVYIDYIAERLAAAEQAA